MKKALISSAQNALITNYDGTSGYRVAEVVDEAFEVNPTELFWVDCEDDVQADIYYYDTSDNTIKIIPIEPEPEPEPETP